MAERKVSGKAPPVRPYRGVASTSVVEAEMNASDLRRLTDDFLGKPVDVTATGQHSAMTSTGTFNARSTSRTKLLRTSLVVLGSVAFAGMIAAAAVLRDSDKQAALPPPPPAVIPDAAPAPEVQVAEAPAPEPVVLTNPFDKTEKFTFPPGTSKADARDQMAQLLLQRAIDRGANRPRARKVATKPQQAPPSTGHGS